MAFALNCGWSPARSGRPCKSEVKPGTPPITGPGASSAHHTSVDIHGGGSKMLRVVHISDTHNMLEEMTSWIPNGDILIHSGDATDNGEEWELRQFRDAMRVLPHRTKLFVPGNHERGLEKWTTKQVQSYFGDACTYLVDAEMVVDGLHVYGCPWGTMWGKKSWGHVATGSKLMCKLAAIPEKLDVLVSHYPPYGVLDCAQQDDKYGADSFEGTDKYCALCKCRHDRKGHWGMPELWEHCQSKKPAALLFGHVHDQNGVLKVGDVVYSNGALASCSRNVASVIDFWMPAADTGSKRKFHDMSLQSFHD